MKKVTKRGVSFWALQWTRNGARSFRRWLPPATRQVGLVIGLWGNVDRRLKRRLPETSGRFNGHSSKKRPKALAPGAAPPSR